MPYGLKLAVSIIGILLLVGSKTEIKDPNIKEIVFLIIQIIFVDSLIFLPWVIKK